MVAKAIKSVKSPTVNLNGNRFKKSFSLYRDVIRMDKNINIEMQEQENAIASDMTKIWNQIFEWKLGVPSPSLLPPGGVKAAWNTPAVASVATIEHDSALLLIHFSASSNNVLCSSVNNSHGVLPSLFFISLNEGLTMVSTSYQLITFLIKMQD